jgi:error-prone DNA polymerase
MLDDVWTTNAVRLGLREIKGLQEEDARLIVEKRGVAYDSMRDVWLRTGLSPRVLERLADADAFGSLSLSRREALWAAKALGRVGDHDDDLPLFAIDSDAAVAPVVSREPDVHLPPMLIGEEVINDYRFLHLSLRAHPAQFLRPDLYASDIKQNDALRRIRSGTRVRISGLVTCRQRPGSANGVVFMTIEDETAVANVIVWPQVFERLRPIVLSARYVAVTGCVQEESGVIHVVAEQLEDLTHFLARLAEHGAQIDGLARCDEVRRPIEDQREAHLAGGRHSRLVRLMSEIPELASDLDVPARGSAHAPTRRAIAAPLCRARH